MSETITKQAEAISVAATTVREVARLTGVLAENLNGLVEMAGKAVDDVHATSLPEDYQAIVAAADERIAAAVAAERKLADAQHDLTVRESAVTAREQAADEREKQLSERAAAIAPSTQQPTVEAEANGSEQPE